ncbi:hypothetical protein LTR84_006109 [Exophiala bonariae]|uniref:Uncharacterized protein n=1 Tax=Exophiala bonariae TaxID=1690606 RepID=A0AAV9N536_9EURO|nr:hypothetical protein LTR84_006109 [Exophiala bonariae]
MPPARRRQPRRPRRYVLGFERAHPNIQDLLIRACDASTPLLLATILACAGVMKRPPWERSVLWYAALGGFLSRWVAVTCAVTWMLNGWGGDGERAAPDADQRGRRGADGAGGNEGGELVLGLERDRDRGENPGEG